MNQVALVELTEQHLRAARGRGVVVTNHWGDVFTVRTDGSFPGFVCYAPLTQAVIYVLTLREIQRFCRNEPVLNFQGFP